MPSVLRANSGFTSELNFAPSGFFSGWNLNLDYIYSKYRDPFTIVDLSQTPDIREGLDGFTSDGRPIYAAIDPNRHGCDARLVGRSEERRVGKECVRTGRSRWSPYN